MGSEQVDDKKPVGVKRYNCYKGYPSEDPNGPHVTFEDYQRMMRIAREALREVSRALEESKTDRWWCIKKLDEALAALGEE